MSKLADVISTGESCNPKQFNELYTQTDKGWISVSELFKAQDEKMGKIISVFQSLLIDLWLKKVIGEEDFDNLRKTLFNLEKELE